MKKNCASAAQFVVSLFVFLLFSVNVYSKYTHFWILFLVANISIWHQYLASRWGNVWGRCSNTMATCFCWLGKCWPSDPPCAQAGVFWRYINARYRHFTIRWFYVGSMLASVCDAVPALSQHRTNVSPCHQMSGMCIWSAIFTYASSPAAHVF